MLSCEESKDFHFFLSIFIDVTISIFGLLKLAWKTRTMLRKGDEPSHSCLIHETMRHQTGSLNREPDSRSSDMSGLGTYLEETGKGNDKKVERGLNKKGYFENMGTVHFIPKTVT